MPLNKVGCRPTRRRIANAAAALTGDQRAEMAGLADNLVNHAAVLPVEAFDRECRDLARKLARDDGTSRHEQNRQARRVRRWADRQTGMCKTLIELDAETDAKMWAAINAALAAARSANQDEGTSFDHLPVDTLVALITGAQTIDQRVPEVSVLIDLASLVDGLHDQSTCETGHGEPLPPDTIRRMACDAAIVPVVLGAGGEVLDVGRANRLATRAQRRALRAMHATCGHPDCTVPFDWCRIHHVVPWERGGTTDPANLLPLCTKHHHLVHEGRWSLRLRPDRTITLTRPDGTIHFDGTTTTASSSTAAPPHAAPAA